MTDEKICVVGVWHLGAVASACLADLGFTVVGFDSDEKRIADLNRGIPSVAEPDLAELITRNSGLGRLGYTTDLSEAVKGAGYVLIAFDTPVNDEDEVDLSEIFDVTLRLAPHLEGGAVILVLSQVPVGTCDQIRANIKENSPSLDFDVACSPENLRLGRAVQGFKNPERLVLGADNDATLDKAEELLKTIGAPVVRVNLRTAEMIKHALNTFLAMSISFINEIANLSDELGADAMQVAAALRTDERISPKTPLRPGLGFAGATLARDLRSLQKLGRECHRETHLVDAILKVNQEQNRLVARKLEKVYGSIEGLTIGILGLTYKPGTDTLRRSVALEIIADLVRKGARVRASDPGVSAKEMEQRTDFEFCADPHSVAQGSDALVLLTEWPQFKNLDFDAMRSSMNRPILIDAQNMLDDVRMREVGFEYLGVGRGQAS